MPRLRSLALLLLAAGPAFGQDLPAAERPSFDCARAAAPLDKRICADPLLAMRDRELAEAFAAVRGAGKEAVAQQRRWLEARGAACPSALAAGAEAELAAEEASACLLRLYDQRIGQLIEARVSARWPKAHRPRLVEGSAPFCKALAADLAASAWGPAVGLNPLGPREIGFAPVAGQPRPEAESGALPAMVARADLHGTGKPVLLLRLDGAESLRQPTVTYRVLLSEKALRAALKGGEEGLSEAGEPAYDPERIRGQRSDEAKPAPVLENAQNWLALAPRFFVEGGKTYVLAALEGGRPGDADLGVYSLRRDGRAAPHCLFRAEAPAGRPTMESVYFLREVGALRAAAAPLMPPRVCGSIGEDRRTMAERAERRPWSLRPRPAGAGEIGTRELAQFLTRRSLLRRSGPADLARYRQAREEAVAAVAADYAARFEAPAEAAREAAGLFVDRLLSDRLMIGPDDAEMAALRAADFPARHAAHRAALAGDAEALRQALAGQPPEAASAAWEDPLLALAAAHPAAVRALLQLGAAPDRSGPGGRTPLMEAALADAPESAQALLDAGADVNAETPAAEAEEETPCEAADAEKPEAEPAGRTALSFAAEAARPALVELLLARGADPRRKDASGRAPADYLEHRSDGPEVAARLRSLLQPRP